MSVAVPDEFSTGQPLVAVLCSVPLVGEALEAAFESIAEVRRFPASRGDTNGLLRWLRPDAVIVDTAQEAEQAAAFACEAGFPLVHVCLRERRLRVLADGAWTEPEATGASAEAVRNILVGAIFGRAAQR